MPDPDNTPLLMEVPEDRRFIKVRTMEDLNDLAALPPNDFERLTTNWHGRK